MFERNEVLPPKRKGLPRGSDSTRSPHSLATTLYTKDLRFVFELFQNAEDNDYTKAEAAGDEALLIFRFYPNEIIIDSNGDGFVEANVRAICSTWGSIKKVSKGYIGDCQFSRLRPRFTFSPGPFLSSLNTDMEIAAWKRILRSSRFTMNSLQRSVRG